MFSSGVLRRAAPRIPRSINGSKRYSSHNTYQSTSISSRLYVGVAIAGGLAVYSGLRLSSENGFLAPLHADVAPTLDADGKSIFDQPYVEEPRRRGSSKEENREIISSQHAQVKRSWENPGVYAWGSNVGRVVAPDSEERFIKSGRRISYFDGVLLRDLKLSKLFGAAINESGDLVQWGVQYAKDVKVPEVTLKGKNLRQLAVSDDRIVALADNGAVYSIPVSKEEQKSEPRPTGSAWLWSSSTNIGCRALTPKVLGVTEKVTSLVGGRLHVLMLTSSGRVFSAASSTQDFPNHGQLGIAGLGWYTRRAGPFDQAHEIRGLSNIKQIAAGDTHSLALDGRGRVFSFGDNSHGQLGVPLQKEGLNLHEALNINPHIIDQPIQIPIAPLYPEAYEIPSVKSIAAGGQNSFFVVEIKRDQALQRTSKNIGDVTSDAWAFGRGIWGTLGIGKWTHVQWGPTKIPALSGMFEYDEATGKPVPIGVGKFNVGESHVAAIMDNITHVSANAKSSQNDTNYGADVYFFGNNENFQLGTGKRNNLAVPTHIQPLGSTVAKTDGLLVPEQKERFQLTPTSKITFAGRSVAVEQRVEVGRQCTAVYSAAV